MGALFSKCCEVEINFRCTLCSERSSSEPEVPIELRSVHNEEDSKLNVLIIEINVGMKVDVTLQ